MRNLEMTEPNEDPQTFREVASYIAYHEELKSEVGIGNIREILRIFLGLPLKTIIKLALKHSKQ